MPLVPSGVKIYHLFQNLNWTHTRGRARARTHTHTHTHTHKGQTSWDQTVRGIRSVWLCFTFCTFHTFYVGLAVLQVSLHHSFLFSIYSWSSHVLSSCWYTFVVLVRALCYLPLFGLVLSTLLAMSSVTSLGICNNISPSYIMCKIRITSLSC